MNKQNIIYDPDWDKEFQGIKPLDVTTSASLFIKCWQTYSRPAEFVCGDGERYVLKSLRTDLNISKPMFNDQVVGRLGAMIGAPVGEVALVDLGADLIAANPDIAHMQPGIAHATRRLPDVSERLDAISYASNPENRKRYAALIVLYWWLGATGDRQFIYGNNPPNLIYSVDHGHFFPGGPEWTIASLSAGVFSPNPPADLMAACGFTAQDLSDPCDKMAAIKAADIARAIMAVPQTWGIPMADFRAAAVFLWHQKLELLTAYHSLVAANP